jgi:hypothetical protein
MISSEDKLTLVAERSGHGAKELDRSKMTNTADCTKTHVEDKGHHHSRLEGYLERLEDKKAYRDFRERDRGTSDYYELVESLTA